MKIKTLMDFLNKDSVDSGNDQVASSGNDQVASSGNEDNSPLQEEKVIYIENARLETASEQSENKELLAGRTQWADQSMGDILIDLGKLSPDDVDHIIEYQREKGLYFGEAAVELELVDQEDILQALSTQFGYTYNRDEESLAKEMVMAYSPFGEQAEEFRTIRAQLLNEWLTSERKTLAIVSPDRKEGRSYVAANLALSFSQLGRSTLLIDADLRSPRQHEIFNFTRKVGLSMLLAGRIKMEDLDVLPDQISNFQHLSVLGCGAIPPNPVELLSNNTFALILKVLKKYFDVIIIDTPPAKYAADVISISAIAGTALLVARSGYSKMDDSKKLASLLNQANVKVAGAVLNEY